MRKFAKIFGKEKKKQLATTDSFARENLTLTIDTIGPLSTNHYSPDRRITFWYVYVVQFLNCSH